MALKGLLCTKWSRIARAWRGRVESTVRGVHSRNTSFTAAVFTVVDSLPLVVGPWVPCDLLPPQQQRSSLLHSWPALPPGSSPTNPQTGSSRMQTTREQEEREHIQRCRQKASNYWGRNDASMQQSYLPTPFGRVGPLLSPEIVTDEVLLPTVHHYSPLVVQHCCRGILEVMYPITNQLQQWNESSRTVYPNCLRQDSWNDLRRLQKAISQHPSYLAKIEVLHNTQLSWEIGYSKTV